MQIKAGIKKEWIYFGKSFRLYGVILAMLAFSMLSPLMMKGAELLVEETSNLIEDDTNIDTSDVIVIEDALMDCPECGHEITYDEYNAAMSEKYSVETDDKFASVDNLFASYNNITYGIALVLSGISSNAILILLLFMMGTAGGEQKKKHVIIPNSSGLTTWGYILPKFIIYPLITFISSFAVSYLGYEICTLLYSETIPTVDVINFILCNSVFCAFMVVLYLTLGLSTGKAGLSVVIVYLLIQIFPTVLEFADLNEYNPFSLMKYAVGINMTVDGVEQAISIAMTVALSIFFMFLTYLFVNLRKIDNQRKVEIANVSDN